jgi:hypothetical protein
MKEPWNPQDNTDGPGELDALLESFKKLIDQLPAIAPPPKFDEEGYHRAIRDALIQSRADKIASLAATIFARGELRARECVEEAAIIYDISLTASESLERTYELARKFRQVETPRSVDPKGGIDG